MADTDEITVVRNDERHRYEALLKGIVVGYISFRLRPGQVVAVHTEIEPEFEGRGIGGALARDALNDIRARGETVVPLCPFVAGYIQRHPAYADLVADTG